MTEPTDHMAELYELLGMTYDVLGDVLDAAEARREITEPGCPGCGAAHAAYMVTADVWDTAGVGAGMWCVGCLEQRLGRPLTADDLEPSPMNIPHFMASDSDDRRQLEPKLAAVKQWTEADWAKASRR